MNISTETLAQRVLRTQQDTHVADPHILAKEILAHLEPAEYHDVLVDILPEFVRGTLVRERIAVSRVQPSTDDDQPTTGRRTGSISKTVRAAEWWQRFLQTSIVGAPTQSGDRWKFLGECTRADLLSAAADRRSQAEALTRVASQLEQVAGLLSDDEATVAVLNPQAVAAIYGVAA